MTLRQLAAKFPDGPGPDVLRVYANRGTLPAEKIGRDWTMSEEDYKAWLAERSPAEGEPSPLPSPSHLQQEPPEV